MENRTETNTAEKVYKNILKSFIYQLEEKREYFNHFPDQYFPDQSKENIQREATKKAIKDITAAFNQFLQEKI